MAKRFKWTLFSIPVFLFGVFILGPRPDYPVIDSSLPNYSDPLPVLESRIKEQEWRVPKLRPDNEARIVWFDGPRKTPYSIVYLHGFNASQGEGDPLHRDLAARYGCNLYLHRLPGHGIQDSMAFRDLTPADLVKSAADALAIGKAIGDKVILVSSSTGSTLSVYLAAKHPDDVDALLMYSPNFGLYSGATRLLTWPWGKQMAQWIIGSEYRSWVAPEAAKNYWTTKYRVEALVCLKSLLEETMTPEIFQQVQQPFFIGYYYKNEELQDKTISVKEILKFEKQVGTPADKRKMVAFPEAGRHVITSRYMSTDLEPVRQETFEFLEKTLGFIPQDENY